MPLPAVPKAAAAAAVGGSGRREKDAAAQLSPLAASLYQAVQEGMAARNEALAGATAGRC